MGWRRRRRDEDFDQEIHAHLDLEADRLVSEGLSAELARAVARRRFGNVTRAKERFYESRRIVWLEQLTQDTRYACRGLIKTPSFTAAAVLTLALGIGANAALFSVVYGVLLRPLPFEDPERLVLIEAWQDFEGQARRTSYSPSDLDQWRQPNVFDSLALAATDSRPLAGDGFSEIVTVGIVTDGFFEALAGRMVLGRPLGPDDQTSPRAVISHELWQRRYAASPGILSRGIVLNRRHYTVVGVAADAYLPRRNTDVWVPVAFERTVTPGLSDRFGGGFNPVARLRAGVSLPEAQAAADVVSRALARAAPQAFARVRGVVVGMRESLAGNVRPTLLILFAAVSLVLLSACANVMHMIVARDMSRGREIAVRMALGASRGRLARQAIAESGVLAAAGAAAGMVVAWGGVTALRLFPPVGFPRLDAVRLDGTFMLFTVLLAGAMALAIGLIKALFR